MTLQVISTAVSVYHTQGVDKDGQPTATEHTYKRGQLLPDWVDSFQAFTLVSCGMAAEVGDEPDGSLRPAEEDPAPVVLPEHGPTTNTGSRPVFNTGGEVASDETLPALPEDSATKPVWEDYAVESLPSDYRMTRVEAEGYKKADLVAEVKSRYAEADDLGSESLPPAL